MGSMDLRVVYHARHAGGRGAVCGSIASLQRDLAGHVSHYVERQTKFRFRLKYANSRCCTTCALLIVAEPSGEKPPG